MTYYVRYYKHGDKRELDKGKRIDKKDRGKLNGLEWRYDGNGRDIFEIGPSFFNKLSVLINTNIIIK